MKKLLIALLFVPALALAQYSPSTSNLATAAKQPALGTAGTASADVITVQGIASATPVIVGGAVAAGATDSGNPVKVGGVYNSTLPTLTNGQRGDAQLGTRGSLHVELFGADSTNGAAVSSFTGDGLAANTNMLTVRAMLGVSNATSFDRARAGIVTPTATLTGHLNTLPWGVYNAAPTVRTEGQGGPLQTTAGGALVQKPYAVADLDWSYAAASTGITNTTTAVVIKTAHATLRNYVTGCQLMAEALGTATELAIRDGAGGTVLWRTKIGTGGLTTGQTFTFPSPLRGTAATLLEVVTLTASGTGAVYVNCQGYQAP